jgi:hypothetical protein
MQAYALSTLTSTQEKVIANLRQHFVLVHYDGFGFTQCIVRHSYNYVM